MRSVEDDRKAQQRRHRIRLICGYCGRRLAELYGPPGRPDLMMAAPTGLESRRHNGFRYVCKHCHRPHPVRTDKLAAAYGRAFAQTDPAARVIVLPADVTG